MATIQLGKIKQVWRDVWSNGSNYAVDDLVSHTDQNITSTYIAVQASTSGSPQAPATSGTVNTSYWNLVAKGVADPIPSQSGNSGKALVTDGSSVSWGQAGTWTKITSGTGPSTSVDAFSLDNIFSSSYKIYKIFYSFAESVTMYGRYIKADGSVESGAYYSWTTHGANENTSGGEHGQWGDANTDTNIVYHWWNGSDNKPALCEITMYDPISSSYATMDMYQSVSSDGNKVASQVGSNYLNSTASIRGLYLWHSGSGQQLDTDFQYLVLGANI